MAGRMNDETVFDRVLTGKLPARKVYEDDDVLAFHDINPQAPVHVLVIPKKKVRSFAALAGWTDEEAGRFFRAVARVASELGLDEPGYRVVVNHGRHAQQSVAYLHAHILGGRPMRWPPG